MMSIHLNVYFILIIDFNFKIITNNTCISFEISILYYDIVTFNLYLSCTR